MKILFESEKKKKIEKSDLWKSKTNNYIKDDMNSEIEDKFIFRSTKHNYTTNNKWK